MRRDRALDTTLNIDETQENAPKESGRESVNVMDHREKQGRENDRENFRQNGDYARPLLGEARIQMPEREDKARKNEEPVDDLLGRAAVE